MVLNQFYTVGCAEWNFDAFRGKGRLQMDKANEAITGTITRRMDSVFTGLENEFKTLYDRADIEKRLADLKRVSSKAARLSKLQNLYELLDACKVPYEKGQTNEYYETLIKEADLPTFQDLEDRVMYAIYKKYEAFPSPEDYMKRIVDRLSAKEDHWGTDTLRLRILKQFIKYGNGLADAGFQGKAAVGNYVKTKTGNKKLTENELLEALDDDVFACLQTAKEWQKKPNGTYGLLKTADDLATGKFRGGNATKKSLYLFAMVYGMTYFDGSMGEIRDYESDIETNLFRDYYTNNLIRFLTESYQEPKADNTYEQDPSGQGINYKNFAEIIYLYYISQDCSPQEKIKRSHEMIKRVQDSKAKKTLPAQEGAEGETGYYRTYVKNGAFNGLLHRSEADFEEFICTHYQTENAASLGALLKNVEQNSAYKTYKKILQSVLDLDVLQARPKSNGAVPLWKLLEDALLEDILLSDNASHKKLSLEDDRLIGVPYGLWFLDVEANSEKRYHTLCHKYPDIDRGKYEALMKLLKKMDKFMKIRIGEDLQSLQTTAKPSGTTAKNISRTTLITAFYYYYILNFGNKLTQEKSFSALFMHFQKEISNELEAAHYLPLDSRNLFDVLIVFSIYGYFNI